VVCSDELVDCSAIMLPKWREKSAKTNFGRLKDELPPTICDIILNFITYSSVSEEIKNLIAY